MTEDRTANLARPVLMPEARRFSDVLEYVGEWDYESMNHHAGRDPAINMDAQHARPIGENIVSPFCSVSRPGDRHRSIAVRATDAAIAAAAPRIVTDRDRLSWKIIEHEGTGRALVILEHGQILGSQWLAYIDADTIPPRPESPRERMAREEASGLEGYHTATLAGDRPAPRGPFGGTYPAGWAPAPVVRAMMESGWTPPEEE